MAHTNVELTRQGFEAAVNGDFDVIASLLDEDVRWHGGDPAFPGACHSRSDALQFMRRARSRGPLGELVDVIAVGDHVVVIMRPGAQAGDDPARLVANLATFRDGKVIEIVHYPDPEDAMAAARASS